MLIKLNCCHSRTVFFKHFCFPIEKVLQQPSVTALMCDYLKSIRQCQNKQKIVVNKVFSEKPQWVLHFLRWYFTVPHWIHSTTRNECILERRHQRRAGVSFPACRGKHLAVCWRLYSSGVTPTYHYRDYARLNPHLRPPPKKKTPCHLLSALQFHNKHSWHSTRRNIRETKWFSIIYSSLQIAYSSSPGTL